MIELEKQAARAGLKLIRRLVQQGTPEALLRADQLARTTGVLKPLPNPLLPSAQSSIYGSQIKQLGGGSEGMATLVADPEFGLSVRKMYNPRSWLASPRMIGRKVQLSKDLQHPNLAEVQGFRRTPTGGRMTFHEYIPEGLTDPGEELWNRLNAKSSLESAAKKKGWTLGDLRKANFVGDVAVDPIAFRQGEFTGMQRVPDDPLDQSSRIVGLTPKGHRALGQKGRVQQLPSGEKAFVRYDKPKSAVPEQDMYRMFFPSKTRASFNAPSKPFNLQQQLESKDRTQTMIRSQHGRVEQQPQGGPMNWLKNKFRPPKKLPSLPGQPPLPGKTTAQWNTIGGSPGVNPTLHDRPSVPSPVAAPKAPSIDWGSRG